MTDQHKPGDRPRSEGPLQGIRVLDLATLRRKWWRPRMATPAPSLDGRFVDAAVVADARRVLALAERLG
ncbi:hypothetical protein [Streptomyces rugosispiralis]|uniref:Uncharacterized protein n=1 Tax=Streptomyces rugosispiralis TaxID=2967341 RepID=A0ABT1VBP9_9ACTN|nr:hypothetical protein [Streptomyces rugosispiralis]MCQ8194817.1 hypothetical protein [Streptomyces rugosispiralis]